MLTDLAFQNIYGLAAAAGRPGVTAHFDRNLDDEEAFDEVCARATA